MAIDIDKLSIGLPDQIEFRLTNKIVNVKTSVSLDRWSEWTAEEREAYIMEWATKHLLNAAIVTSQIGYAPKAVKPYEVHVEPRPIKDNPQA